MLLCVLVKERVCTHNPKGLKGARWPNPEHALTRHHSLHQLAPDVACRETWNIKCQLQDLYLNDNNLDGGIPERMVVNCERLQRLYLGGNHLTGTVPRALRHVRDLRELNIERNNFHGEVRNVVPRIAWVLCRATS